MKENGQEIPEMEYPQIGEEPVDEYNYQHMFADAYPWLFPGGIKINKRNTWLCQSTLTNWGLYCHQPRLAIVYIHFLF